jgi:uncharacterized protein YjgD (DUF1641 family)
MLLRLDMSLRRQDQHIANQLLDLIQVEELSRQLNNSRIQLELYHLFDTFSILAITMNLPNTHRSPHWVISQVTIPAMTIRKRRNT